MLRIRIRICYVMYKERLYYNRVQILLLHSSSPTHSLCLTKLVFGITLHILHKSPPLHYKYYIRYESIYDGYTQNTLAIILHRLARVYPGTLNRLKRTTQPNGVKRLLYFFYFTLLTLYVFKNFTTYYYFFYYGIVVKFLR